MYGRDGCGRENIIYVRNAAVEGGVAPKFYGHHHFCFCFERTTIKF